VGSELLVITVNEDYESRPLADGDAPASQRTYVIVGTASESDALTALLNAAPATVADLVRKTWKVDPLAVTDDDADHSMWRGQVSYGRTSNKPPKTGDSRYNFDITSGGAVHLTAVEAVDHICDHALPGKTIVSHAGLIGWNGEDLEGVDVDDPIFKWSETHYIAKSLVTTPYKGKLYAVRCAPVNKYAFRGFLAGEVKFEGVSGSERGGEDCELTFSFTARPNRKNFTIGEIDVPSKDGWDYLWLEYRPKPHGTAKMLVPQAILLHIERVFKRSDFTELGIGDEPL
jgi:hypothetical protein